MKQTMLIVGLGLIGGSLALALKGFEDFEIVGVDVSQPTLRYAAEHGVGDRVTEDAAAELPQADVVALALHPRGSWISWPGIGMRSSRGPWCGTCAASRPPFWRRPRCCPVPWILSAATPWRAPSSPAWSTPLRRCSGTPTSCWCPGMTAGRSTLPCWSGWRPISAARTYAAPPPRPTTP